MNLENRSYRVALLCLLILAFVEVRTRQWSYTPDDTFIYLRFAENLSATGKFAFNPGTPTYGMTGPMWAGLASSLLALPVNPLQSVKILDLFLAIGAILLTYRLARDAGASFKTSLFASTTLAVDAWFLRWSATGMETSAFTAAMLASVVLMNRQPLLSGLAGGIATLLRPEGILLAPVIAWVHRKKAISFFSSLGAFFVPVGSWLLYAWISFRTLLPNTFAGKTGEEASLAGIFLTFRDVVLTIAATQAVVLIVIFIAVVFLIRKKDFAPLSRLSAFSWVILLVLGYAVKEVDVISRYLVPAHPFIIVAGFVLLEKTLNRWSVSSRVKSALVVSVVAITMLQNVWVYQTRVLPHMIAFSDGMRTCLLPIALYINQATERDATVLVPDVGLMGYAGKRTMLDVAGLITPGVRTLFHNRTYDEGMTQGVWKPLRPRYVLDRSVAPERLASDSLIPLISRRFGPLALRSADEVYYTLYRYSASH